MTKPLSETHPTLWETLLDSPNTYDPDMLNLERVWQEDIQSCTVDREEHERDIIAAFFRGFKEGKAEGIEETLLRVKEAIEKVHELTCTDLDEPVDRETYLQVQSMEHVLELLKKELDLHKDTDNRSYTNIQGDIK